ncbi:MAG: amidohydrolase family protein [Chloroflexota bacterium]
MRVVDAQVHIWSAGRPTTATHRQIERFSAEDLLKEMAEAGVDAALLHPPGWDPNATAVAIEAVKKYPDRFAILGNFPLDKPESRDLIATWKNQPGMLGLRFTFHAPHQRTWPHDGSLDWLWPAAERAGIPIALQAARFLPTVGFIAERHPGLKLIVDHCGGLGGTAHNKGADAFTHIPDLVALARFPNVALKATGAPHYSSDPYPFTSIHTYLRQMFDAFGPDRMFWGTDVTRMQCTYRQCVQLFTEQLPWLKGDDLDKVMGGALRSWIGWK